MSEEAGAFATRLARGADARGDRNLPGATRGR
jgi:hypothetical protein